VSVAGVPNPFGAITGAKSPATAVPPATPVEVLGGFGGVDATQIDALMERASAALLRMDYFETIELSLRAMERSRRKRDWERVARITMPLQEARRQIRQLATDVRKVHLLQGLPTRGVPMEPGLYLLEPPMIGLDGTTVRDMLRARKVPAMVLVKEPTTSAGKWPIVGVGRGEFENVVARVQLDPPAQLAGHAGPVSGADADTVQHALADGTWFQTAQEALGDAAIKKVRSEWPAAHRVDDLAEYLDAVPDHEKLSQALESTAREAMTAPIPALGRRRPYVDNPYGI
jgi:hypothetical protein